MPANIETMLLNTTFNEVTDLKQHASSPDVNVLNKSISDVAFEKLTSITSHRSDKDKEGAAFCIADLGEVYRQHLRWKSLLPRIEPFYAIKCSPDPLIVKLLASLGTGFDCASKKEIQQVLDAGVEPHRIIYANPCKQSSFISYAAQQNVSLMTFDNAEELHKIKKLYPDAKLVLRILTDDSRSMCQLGLKFGAPLHTVEYLLKTAKSLDLNVVGVSFHVGSGCYDESAFVDAIIRARRVFDQGQEVGYNFTLLDVGGGFPSADVKDGTTFEKIAHVLAPEVDRLFPPEVRVIAEPGRYYVASAFTVCTNIIARRSATSSALPDENSMETEKNQEYMYYMNDGVYGTFNNIFFDHQVVYPKVLMKDEVFMFGKTCEETHFESSVWGPTCDSLDCVNKSTRLPKLEPGDWLYYENMGAYTVCIATQFNGFEKSEVIYTNTFC